MYFIDELEKNLKLDTNAEDMLKATEEELELNLAHRLEARQEVDAVFGSGMWRPLPMHMLFQDGRPRSIDDAKKGLQNWFSTVCETIVCASAE